MENFLSKIEEIIIEDCEDCLVEDIKSFKATKNEVEIYQIISLIINKLALKDLIELKGEYYCYFVLGKMILKNIIKNNESRENLISLINDKSYLRLNEMEN